MNAHSRWHNGVRRGIHGAIVLMGAMAILTPTSGCGKHRLDVAPVHGRVVYKGQGVPRAIVIFHPEGDVVEQAKKMRPFAYADNDGNFQLKTYVEDDGAPPGEYRVTIIAASSGGGTGKRIKDESSIEQSASPARGASIPPAITKKYANLDTAGIKVTIHDGENSLEPFVL